jgi:hypothetical protein
MPRAEFSPSTPGTTVRPPCPKCRSRMMLARIEPDKPDHDKRTFECSKCDNIESVVVKYR